MELISENNLFNNEFKKLNISVKDDGIGIKKEDQGKIFRLFGSIKDRAKNINTDGIGIGLVISKQIVQKFGG